MSIFDHLKQANGGFNWEIPYRCEMGVHDPRNIDNGGVSACGEPAPYRVWWDDEDNGLYVCEEHFDQLQAQEECDYRTLHRCQWDVSTRYGPSGYTACGKLACYLVSWENGYEEWLCKEHFEEVAAKEEEE